MHRSVARGTLYRAPLAPGSLALALSKICEVHHRAQILHQGLESRALAVQLLRFLHPLGLGALVALRELIAQLLQSVRHCPLVARPRGVQLLEQPGARL